MDFPAHIVLSARQEELAQSVIEHCRNTAEYAASCLKITGMDDAAYLAGLLHDAGKYQTAYRTYLTRAVHGAPVQRGEVIHTFQGCRMLLEHFHSSTSSDYRDVTAELLSFAVGAHHGLFDCVGTHGESGFLHRIQKENVAYEEVCDNFLKECGGWSALETMFSKAEQNLLSVYETISRMSEASEANQEKADAEVCFYLGLLARLLLSAVIEGDRRDTAEFLNQITFPQYPEDMRPIWKKRLTHMEEELDQFPADTPLQKARQSISNQCRAFAERHSGVYRLNVPTGAGKTLSSLRFALAHAETHGLRRIIFTAPLLAILEQNAAVIRKFLGDDSLILEHHSNVIHAEENSETLDDRELLMENWNAPVIITTLVQLLDTLFSGKTSAIRRFQALCGSVIVIDEVQNVPNRMLTLFNLAVNFLSEVCGATLVLCSATQPCLESACHPLLAPPEDMVPYDAKLWAPFLRTSLQRIPDRKLDEMPAFLSEQLHSVDSLLVVCNKRDEAESLFRALSHTTAHCFHLSASMCTAHRRETLSAMEATLQESRANGTKVLCISTQVIEAGVDISFERVVRFLAGMDSVIQSAGRCNRNGEAAETSPVYMVNCADESLGRLRDIADAKKAAIDMLNVFEREPERFQNDPASDQAIRYYYRSLYRNMNGGYQDDVVSEKRTIFDLLSINEKYADEDCEAAGKFTLNQAFRTAGALFQVFDDGGEKDVVVPYGEGEALIAELSAQGGRASPAFLADWLKRVKPYTISLYDYQVKQLEASGDLHVISGVLLLQPGLYDEHIGLTTREKLGFLGV